MENARARSYRTLAVVLLVVTMIFAAASVLSSPAYAGQKGEKPVLGKLTTDMLSQPRQPSTHGIFAWYAVYDEDDYYSWNILYSELKPEDFTLQMRPEGGEWTDVPGRNVAVVGDTQTCANFEAIIAANIPDNKDNYRKEWRVVYLPQHFESAVITQGAADENVIKVFDPDNCIQYPVEQLPWSYEQYQKDNVPPIYVTYADANSRLRISDQGLTRGKDHKIYPAHTMSSFSMDSYVQFKQKELNELRTDMNLGVEDQDLEDPEESEDRDGIAGLVRYWKYDISYMFTSPVPEAKVLYNKLLPYTQDLSNPGGTKAAIFWVHGAADPARAEQGVNDYILVVIRDEYSEDNPYQYSYQGVEVHPWGEPTWTWTGSDEDGYTGAQAEFVCETHDYHTKTLKSTVRSEVDGANRVYTASVTLEGKEYTGTKTVANNEKMDSLAALQTAINDAIDDMNDTFYSEDGKGIEDGAKYVNNSVKTAMEKAITDASAVYKAESSKADLDAAAAAVASARDAFDNAKRIGGQSYSDPSDEPAAKDPLKQLGEGGSPVGKGASFEAANKAITSASSDEGPAGTRYGAVQLRTSKQSRTSVSLQWNKVRGASKYVVYGNVCGKTHKMKKLATVTTNAKTVKKLKKGKYYKYIVVALDKNNNVVTTSKTAHVATKGGNVCNVAKVTTRAKTAKVTLKKGKTFKLSAKKYAVKGKKLKTHRGIKYESTNAKYAVVSSKGVIKAKTKGTCYVYAYAQDGSRAKVKVTVK